MRKSIFRITEPASIWFEGHLLGNGDTGAAVWGGPEDIRIGFSKYDVNYFEPPCGVPGWEAPYPELVRRIHAGDRDFLTRYGHQTRRSEPFACGTLSVTLLRDDYKPEFVQELDPALGECRIRLKMPELYRRTLGKMPPPPIAMRVRVLADRNVTEIRLAAPEKRRVNLLFTPGMFDLPGLGDAALAPNLCRRSLPENLQYAVTFDGAELVPTPIGLAGGAGIGGGAGKARNSAATRERCSSGSPSPPPITGAIPARLRGVCSTAIRMRRTRRIGTSGSASVRNPAFRWRTKRWKTTGNSAFTRLAAQLPPGRCRRICRASGT